MNDVLLKQLKKRKKPIEVIMVGLGFMGFGFFSGISKNEHIKVPVIVTRRPKESVKFLKEKGYKAKITSDPQQIREYSEKGYVCLTSDLDVISRFDAEVVMEVTGTVSYGAEVAIRTLSAQKHLVTMNPELQATVGTELKQMADRKGVVITDVAGDQPGSLARMISHARFMGYEIVVAGNMKRYMDQYATQEQMAPWAKDKGLAVRQTTSFTDGTKQSIEMTLVANYFGFNLAKPSMIGPQIEKIEDVLTAYDFDNLPTDGIVDYVIGRNLFPGIFLVVKHKDKHQQKYLRYLGLGDGPYYVLFEPYHLCHLEVPETIAKAVLFGHETINNSLSPVTETATYAKRDLRKGEILDGIGGDLTYGAIVSAKSKDILPAGLAEGSVVTSDIKKDQPIRLRDVALPVNAATVLKGYVQSLELSGRIVRIRRSQKQEPSVVRVAS